jgi:hypothetical protein
MRRLVRDPKDFWSGAIFLGVGLGAVVFAREHSMGTATRMGPAYFPTVLGALLALIGLILAVRSLVMAGERIDRPALRMLALVLGANVLFGLLLRQFGLAISLLALVMVSGCASQRFTWGASLGLAIGLAAFSVLVFVKVLGLPIPLLGTWLGG